MVSDLNTFHPQRHDTYPSGKNYTKGYLNALKFMKDFMEKVK
jgi:hypothetical protein